MLLSLSCQYELLLKTLNARNSVICVFNNSFDLLKMLVSYVE
jgi:hypothetical protein